MRVTRVRLALALSLITVPSCSSVKGPSPTIESVAPDVICTAQADTLITLTGSGFSPVVVDGLTDSPSVMMPMVYLVSPSGETEVPPAGVALPAGDSSGTVLEVTVPMGLVGPTGPNESAVVYDVRVVNPNGNETTLTGALTVVPPPNLTSIDPIDGAQGTTVTVTLSGTGFRDGMTVTLDATPVVPGANVTVVDGTTATVDFDLTDVAAGTYDVTVVNPDGCSSTLAGAFTVFIPHDLMLVGIEPPFGCTCSPTTVTITSAGGFVSTPRVEMRLDGTGTPIDFERVAFIDETTITAVVPEGAPLGIYDVIVTNPPSDGGIGTLVDAFRVVERPIPTIEAVVPSRGSTQDVDLAVTIYGENFRGPVKIELIDSTGAVVLTTDPMDNTVVSANEITTIFDIDGAGLADGPYLVRVTNLDEDTYSTFSNFVVGDTGPSGNLVNPIPEPSLKTGRRLLAGVVGRDDLGNRYLYAIGGDTGAGGTTLDDVEVTQLSAFGELSEWRPVPNTMATPRAGAAAVFVPVFDTEISAFVPVKSYLYVLGGSSDGGTTILSSVERAAILSGKDVPKADASAAPDAGSLDAGTWYYKVSAVLTADDPDNPSGETLPSDEAIITIGGSTSSVQLTWDAITVNGLAVDHYRVYRTDAVNGVSQTEHLIADNITDTSYLDTGASPGTEAPLPPGSTGVWIGADPLPAVRWGHQAAVVKDAGGARYVYVIGGKSDNAAGYLGTVVWSPIAEADGSLGGFVADSTNPMNIARAFFTLTVQTAENVSKFALGSRFFVIGGVVAGDGSGEATDSIEYCDIVTDGGNSTWTDWADSHASNPTLPQTRAGLFAAITKEKLFVLGGAQVATNTSFSSVNGGNYDVQFIDFATDSGRNLGRPMQSSSLSFGDRALGVTITGSGFIYMVGGSSDGSNAVGTTERTF